MREERWRDRVDKRREGATGKEWEGEERKSERKNRKEEWEKRKDKEVERHKTKYMMMDEFCCICTGNRDIPVTWKYSSNILLAGTTDSITDNEGN